MIPTKVKQWQLICFLTLSVVTVFVNWLLILNYGYFQSLNGGDWSQVKNWFRFFENDGLLYGKFVYILSASIFFTLFFFLLSVILVNRLRMKTKCRRSVDIFLINSTTLPDDIAVTIFNARGLSFDNNKAIIDMTFLRYASPNALAQALCFLLHLQSQKHLDDWINGEANVFHELAKILLEYCDAIAINQLIEFMAIRKLYLAQFLGGAIRRVELEKELAEVSAELKQNILTECKIISNIREEVEEALLFPNEPPISVLRFLASFWGKNNLSDSEIRNFSIMSIIRSIMNIGNRHHSTENSEYPVND